MNCITAAVEDLLVEGKVGGFDSRVGRMENDGEIAECFPLLNTF
jgi:hypothetical protein